MCFIFSVKMKELQHSFYLHKINNLQKTENNFHTMQKSTNGLLVQESAGKSAGKISMMEGKGRGKVLRHPFKEFPILKDKQKLAF